MCTSSFLGDIFLKGHHVLIARNRTQFLVPRRLDESEAHGGQNLVEKVRELGHDAALLLPNVNLIGQPDQELQELDKLHILVLRRVHGLIDDSHLCEVKLHPDYSVREQAADTFEQFDC